MFAKMRIPMRRRLGLAVAACGAMLLLSASDVNAQMCASGGSTGGGGGTSTGSSTGSSSSRSTGSSSSASNTASLVQAVQTASMLQAMAEQESRVQAIEAMRAAQYEAAVTFEAGRQIELRRTARLSNAQKQREMRAARGQRKPGKSAPRPEAEVRTASR